MEPRADGGRRARVEPATLHLEIHAAHHGHGPVCGRLRGRQGLLSGPCPSIGRRGEQRTQSRALVFSVRANEDRAFGH
jgi:hypothetical protein